MRRLLSSSEVAARRRFLCADEAVDWVCIVECPHGAHSMALVVVSQRMESHGTLGSSSRRAPEVGSLIIDRNLERCSLLARL